MDIDLLTPAGIAAAVMVIGWAIRQIAPNLTRLGMRQAIIATGAVLGLAGALWLNDAVTVGSIIAGIIAGLVGAQAASKTYDDFRSGLGHDVLDAAEVTVWDRMNGNDQ